jgi:predicted transcriptional regulator
LIHYKERSIKDLTLHMGDKKVFATRVDGDRIKELKHLAVDTDRSLGDLLEEAIQDLLKKYEKKAK